MWTGVHPGDGRPTCTWSRSTTAGPQRWPTLGRQALHCIRCSACLNVCPVYERTGGHAYGSAYPGPIGAILSPQLTGVEDNASLPFASSLCGACYDVCPVKINIPDVLVHLRARHVEERRANRTVPNAEELTMAAAGWVMAEPRRYTAALRAARPGRILAAARDRIRALPPPLSAWTASRDAPKPPDRDVPRLVGAHPRRER